ncbi:MAG: hypothetical protein ACW98X_26230 [Promethearchaeota archaeon]|jgi:hypothetical protein
MSLLVLSNDEKFQSTLGLQSGGISAPNSFTNVLTEPLVIEKDSEVALQSLKVQKSATITVNTGNNKIWTYIGRGRDANFFGNEDPRLTAPTRFVPRDDYTAQSFVDECLLPSLRKAIYHPDYQDRLNGSVKEDANGNFEGYNIKYGEGNTPPADVFPADDEFIAAAPNSTDFTWTNSNKRFTKGTDANTRGYGIASRYPMSARQAKHVVNFANASVYWAVSLSRYAAADLEAPPWGVPLEKNWADFAVIKEEGTDLLKLYHAVQEDTGFDELTMREVQYYGYTGATYATPYDLGTNASGFNELEFFIDGEQVELYLRKGGASRTKVCSPELGTPAKDNYFKPINMCCAYLYPKYELTVDNSYFTMVSNEAVNVSNFIFDGNYKLSQDQLTRQDFYVTAMSGHLPFFNMAKDADLNGKYNDFDSFSADEHTFQRFSDQLPKIVLIVAPDPDYYEPSDGANSNHLLGFDDETILDNPTQTSGFKTFSSHETPDNIVRESMFIRLSSLTQRSKNGFTGNDSKIIYHCPRFDTSGQDQGQLYYEPTEKTYLDIGNIMDTPTNSFTIEMVNRQEKLVPGLVGNTTAVLHIRKKKQ